MFIYLKDLSLSFPAKNCFENISAQIYSGFRVAIIGRNGCGKSSLLKILAQRLEPTSGQISVPDGLSVAYVEQVIEGHTSLSGGQKFNKRLSEALVQTPDVLLLDEPTNHLDGSSRRNLLRHLKSYSTAPLIDWTS